MKALLSVAFAFLFSNATSQSPYGVQINFSDSANDQFIEIDTVLFQNNIWQIGFTSKDWVGFGRMLITDTVNSYPTSNRSVFKVKIGKDIFTSWNVALVHLIDADSLHDGGYIELSSDNGVTWSEISTVATFDYANSDFEPVNLNDTATFTGRGGGLSIWNFPWQGGSDWLYLRFVFKSDSISESKSGWGISGIYTEGLFPENVDLLNAFPVALHPNPVEYVVNVVSSQVLPSTTISISDTRGQTLLTMPFPPDGKIDVSALPAGLYHIIYSDQLHQAVKPLCIVR